MKITAHCIVKNEDIWVWYALNSVLKYVDEILIFDTGSFDKTVEVINSINSPKIIFEKKGEVDKVGLTKLRMEQLGRTKTDWFLILDGDEIWPEDNLKTSINLINNSKKETVALIHKVRNCIGDIYHYQSEELGDYKIGKYTGNLNIRFIKKTSGMRVQGEYPLEFYGDENGSVQEQVDNLTFANTWYLHTSFLLRSSVDKNKVSGSFKKRKLWQKGLSLKKNELPQVLFDKRNDLKFDHLRKRGLSYEIKASLLDPLLQLKRKSNV